MDPKRFIPLVIVILFSVYFLHLIVTSFALPLPFLLAAQEIKVNKVIEITGCICPDTLKYEIERGVKGE